jgi:hypothetical protein
MVDYLTYHNNTNHSINNMHGGLLNLPQQYQLLYKQLAWWMHVVYIVVGIVVVG